MPTSTPTLSSARYYDEGFREEVLKLYNKGMSMQRISKELCYAYPSIRKLLKELGKNTSKSRVASKRMPRRTNGHGYICIYNPEHGNSDVDGYVREHVLVVSGILGRNMCRGEVIHHINGNKTDNEPSNLVLLTNAQHMRLHQLMSKLYQQEHPEEAKQLALEFAAAKESS